MKPFKEKQILLSSSNRCWDYLFYSNVSDVTTPFQGISARKIDHGQEMNDNFGYEHFLSNIFIYQPHLIGFLQLLNIFTYNSSFISRQFYCWNHGIDQDFREKFQIKMQNIIFYEYSTYHFSTGVQKFVPTSTRSAHFCFSKKLSQKKMELILALFFI